MSKRWREVPIKAAARAHTDLSVFHAIINLLEGGLISSDSYPNADRIISICKKESAKCLQRYDRALAENERGRP
jgi:hypothetical protein